MRTCMSTPSCYQKRGILARKVILMTENMGFREKSGQRLSTQPNLSGLPAGTYLIRYTTAAGIRTAVVVYCGR